MPRAGLAGARALLCALLAWAALPRCQAAQGVLVSCYDSSNRLIGQRTTNNAYFDVAATNGALYGLYTFSCVFEGWLTPSYTAPTGNTTAPPWRAALAWQYDDNLDVNATLNSTGQLVASVSGTCCTTVRTAFGADVVVPAGDSLYIRARIVNVGGASYLTTYSKLPSSPGANVTAGISGLVQTHPANWTIPDAWEAAANVPASETAALAQVYALGGGSFWTPRGSGWDNYNATPQWYGHPCSWSGVDCSFYRYYPASTLWAPSPATGNNRTAFISTITLSNRGLRGSLTAALAPLASITNLQRLLVVSNGQLIGALPPSFDNASALVLLDVSSTGVVLSNMPRMRSLLVLNAENLAASARAQSFDDTWPRMTALATISIKGNAFTALPQALGTMASLITLDVTSGSLQSIPADLCGAPALRTLRLAQNSISSVASCFVSTLPALVTWNMSANRAAWSIPTSAGQGAFPSLTTVDLTSSGVTDLAGAFYSAPRLSTLLITRNSLSRLSQGLFCGGSPMAVTALDLSYNPWTSLPNVLLTQSCLPQLRWLGIVLAPSLAQLPPIANLTQLTTIIVANTGITSLPAFSGSFPALTTIQLTGNPALTSISNDVSQLPALATLTVQDNTALTTIRDAGTGPSQVVTGAGANVTVGFPALTTLRLTNNSLTALPASLAYARQLRTLIADYNNLVESPSAPAFPPGTLSQPALTSVTLDNNPLRALPAALNTSRATAVSCVNCRLTTIDSACGASALDTLLLSTNSLASLPVCLGFLPRLRVLDMTGNAVAALPPTWAARANKTCAVVNVTALACVNGTGNATVCSNVTTPVSVNCTTPIALASLTTLLAAHNRLRMVDLQLLTTNATGLVALSLRNNTLFGVIPQSIARLTALVSLDLAFNLLISLPPPASALVTAPDGTVRLAGGTMADQVASIDSPGYPAFAFNFAAMPALATVDVSSNLLSGALNAEAFRRNSTISYFWGVAFDVTGNAFDCPLPAMSGCDMTNVCKVSACAPLQLRSATPSVFSAKVATSVTVASDSLPPASGAVFCEFQSTTGGLVRRSPATVSGLSLSCLTPGFGSNPVGLALLRIVDAATSPATVSRPLPPLEFVDGCAPGYSLNPAWSSADSGSSYCSICPVTTYAPAFGSATCTRVGQGYEAIVPGAMAPTPCAAGWAASAEADRCSPCSSGSFSNATASSSCYTCAAGSFTPPIVASTACTDCPLGRFAPLDGSSSCSLCDKASFANTTRLQACFLCPPNSEAPYRGASAATDCLCKAGFYGPAGGPCLPCPDGGLCVGATTDPPRAIPGYWVDAHADPTVFFKCSPPEACLGYTGATNGSECATGYVGSVCSRCLPLEFYKLSGACVPCPKRAGLMWFVMALVALLACALLLRMSQPRDGKLYSPAISLTFIQLVALFKSLGVPWPDLISATYSVASSSNANIELFSPECSVPLTFWSKYVFKTTIPFVFASIMFTYWASVPLARRWQRTVVAAQHAAKRTWCTRVTMKYTVRGCMRAAALSALVGRFVANVLVVVLSWVALIAAAPLLAIAFGARWLWLQMVVGIQRAITGTLCMACEARWTAAQTTSLLHARVRTKAGQGLRRRGRAMPWRQRCALLPGFRAIDVCTFWCCTGTCCPLDPDIVELYDAETRAGGGAGDLKRGGGGGGFIAVSAPKEASDGVGSAAPPLPRKRFSLAPSAIAAIGEAGVGNRMGTTTLPVLARQGSMVSKDGVLQARNLDQTLDALSRTARGHALPGDEKWAGNPLFGKPAVQTTPPASPGNSSSGGGGSGFAGLRRSNSLRRHSVTSRERTTPTTLSRRPAQQASVARLLLTRKMGGSSTRLSGAGAAADGFDVVSPLKAASRRRSTSASPAPSPHSDKAPAGFGVQPSSAAPSGRRAASAEPPRRPQEPMSPRRMGAALRVRTVQLQQRRRAAGIVSNVVVAAEAAPAEAIGFGLTPMTVIGGYLRRRRAAEAALDSAASKELSQRPVKPAPSPLLADPEPETITIQRPGSLQRFTIEAWKLGLMPRTAADVEGVRRFDIDTVVADRFIYACVSLLTVAYTFLASSSLEPLNCVTLANGNYVLKASQDVSCVSEEYRRYLPWVVLVAAFYIAGIPITLLVLLLRGRALGRIGTPRWDYRFGSLTLPYHRSVWFFELVSTARKLAIIIVVQFMGRDGTITSTLTQLMAAMSVFSLYAVLQIVWTPYTTAANNTLSLVLNLALLFLLFSGLLYCNRDLSLAASYYTAVASIVVLAMCGALIITTVLAERRRVAARAETCSALGVNRYQLEWLEDRVVLSMFNRSAPRVVSEMHQLSEVDKDKLLHDLFILRDKMPQASSSAAAKASEARLAAAGKLARRRVSLTHGGQLLWTGQRMELIDTFSNPLVAATAAAAAAGTPTSAASSYIATAVATAAPPHQQQPYAGARFSPVDAV